MTEALDEILDSWRKQAASADYSMAHAAGNAFERLCLAYLEKDPVQSGYYSNVVPWAEWARRRNLPESDDGIDLVAELKREPGRFAAVQCKFRSEGGTIAKGEIDSFISRSSRPEFAQRVLIETTGRAWSSKAEGALRGLAPPATRIGIQDLRSSPINWAEFADHGHVKFADRKQSRPHQAQAISRVAAGLAAEKSRGKLLMACGTGKTLTALRIAEKIAGPGKRVLYLVPSLALMAQTVREWCADAEVPLRAFAVCSDSQVGKRRRRDDDLIDMDALDLAFPATTSAEELAGRASVAAPETMIVLFATYQSSKVIQEAQALGLPEFDLAVCDEAHRTAGAIIKGKERDFVRVHKQELIQAARRLYMTATPKIYAASARAKADELAAAALCSMDDETIYGPVLHELGFGEAVERDLLCDFRVVVLTVPEAAAARLLAGGIEDSQIGLPDAAKLIGCWRALAKSDAQSAGFPEAECAPMNRAIAFCNTIKNSKKVDELFDRVAERHRGDEGLAEHPVEARHIDGTFNAATRAKELEWLSAAGAGECRVLTNARCLSEGVDVPDLDAVLFMHPRKSQLEIVQAVGRVMRKARGKRMGYVVLPVMVEEGSSPEEALKGNEQFGTVWQTLNALRSHDERFNAMIQRMAHGDPGDRISIITPQDWNPPRTTEDGPGIGRGTAPDPDAYDTRTIPMEFTFQGLPEAIRTMIVEKCGDRVYWQDWAGDVAAIAKRHIARIRAMIDDSVEAMELFDDFLAELRSSLNESVTDDEAIEMLAQHMVTGPVFDALFGDDGFTERNPVGKGMRDLIDVMKPTGMDAESELLEGFYASVRRRVQDASTAKAKQAIVVELYDSFFRNAFPETSDKLGIAFTPVEIVDFILKSADAACRREFGASLGTEGVRILDPFTGTGTFLVRLLQLGLVPSADLERKYASEMHANDIMLLPYYIASINIETAFREVAGRGGQMPFSGICLADTFAATETADLLPQVMPTNSKRIGQQQKLDMQVVIGNPPWRAWQESSEDFNPNTIYPRLRKRIEETYASRSRATLKNSLYDTYKMAIRWASDRIGDRGIVAVVTNGSWIDGNADSGIRACLAEEFSSVHVVNLRGNQRTQGERSRREGGKVFGSGSRAPVAITVLAKNPDAKHDGCSIRYCEVEDGMTREEKLDFLTSAGSTEGITDWKKIRPDEHHDWIKQRNPEFSALMPLGTKDVKAGRSGIAAFRLFSNGIKTGRDAHLYNFDRAVCTDNAAREVERCSLDTGFDPAKIRIVHYRPFVPSHCYLDFGFMQRKGQQDQIFPTDGRENHAICVSGIGSTKPFSVLATDMIPDLELISKGQCFPRYLFPVANDTAEQGGFDLPEAGREDNITDDALRLFRGRYPGEGITKDGIFDYVYGVLHAPDFRARFKNNFPKELPRIPFFNFYQRFRAGGGHLIQLHLGFRDCPAHPLELEIADGAGDLLPKELFRIGSQMRFADDKKSSLWINEFVTLHGIPLKAHEYVVNGRTPLEWIIDRYRVAIDKKSNIVNDPNGWFEQPEDLIDAICRAVHLSVETAKIVDGLPPALET